MPDRGGVTLHFAWRVIHSAQMSSLNKAGHRGRPRDSASAKSAGTNTRSAPRRHAPRRPCCSLCCARARSGWRARQLPGAFRWELGLVAPLLPAAPFVPRLRNRSVSRRQHPNRSAWKRKTSFPFRNTWSINEIAKTSSAYTPIEMQSSRPHVDLFRAQSADLPWPIRRGRVASSAREVRQAIVWLRRKSQGCYGSAQTIDSPFSVPRLTFPPSPRGLLLRFHAHHLFAARRK